MSKELTKGEHIKRHYLLHKYLDELVADMIENTDYKVNGTTVMELIEWSYQQTINPVGK